MDRRFLACENTISRTTVPNIDLFVLILMDFPFPMPISKMNTIFKKYEFLNIFHKQNGYAICSEIYYIHDQL